MYKFIKVLKILVKITPETIPGILFEERFVRFVADFFVEQLTVLKGFHFGNISENVCLFLVLLDFLDF